MKKLVTIGLIAVLLVGANLVLANEFQKKLTQPVEPWQEEQYQLSAEPD